MDSIEVFEVLHGGAGTTIQDAGRFGWQRFGIPSSGPMDEHAFHWANRLLDNPPGAASIEIMLGGFRARTLADCHVALAGADLGATVNGEPLAPWRTAALRTGDIIAFGGGHAGLWCYLAVEGSFDVSSYFGSACVYQRGGLGRALQSGDILRRKPAAVVWAGALAGRFVAAAEIPDYTGLLVARVVPGPQEEMFPETEMEKFYGATYKVTSQIDRTGYRLEGPTIRATAHDIISEGIACGAVQIPENGQPIVMMKDCPTVGGYPKIGTLLPEDLARLAQCRPGQTVRFVGADSQ